MIYDKEYFKKYIDSLVQSYDYYNNKIKYVIIDDFDCINITTQRYLKVILEKTFKTTRFILITNKLNSIDIAIISRCSLIRIPTPSYVDKKIYLTNLFNKHGIFYNDFLLEKDCKSNTLEGIIHKYQLNGLQYEDIYSTYKDKLLDILIINKFNIQNIRQISSSIKELNINIEKLFKILLSSLIKIVNISKIFILIKEISKYNHILNDSYRDIIYIELIIIEIFKIINT